METHGRSAVRNPMTFAEGNDRARFLMMVRDRIGAEIAGLQNGSLVVLNDGDSRTAADIASALGVTQQGANNYLTALWRAGLVDRDRIAVEGGGRAFAYSLRMEESEGHDVSAANERLRKQVAADAAALQAAGLAQSAASARAALEAPAEHGLHGERQECFVCGGPVEQVPMMPVVRLREVLREIAEFVNHDGHVAQLCRDALEGTDA